MLVYAPQPSVYHPVTMSKPSKPIFKRQKTHSDAARGAHELPSRSASPAGSFYGDGLRPNDLPPRGPSPASSLYSQLSLSSPSIASTSSGSRKPLPVPPTLTLGSSWLARSPRTPASLNILTPPPDASEFASPPGTPMEVPQAELRRRQLEKATRILGESVPLELVFQPRNPLVRSFPDPPPRRSTDSPLPGQQAREVLTERRAGKIVRRASLSLSTFTSKFRGGSASTNHSRDSSQESYSGSSSSDHSHQAHSRGTPSSSAFARSMPRRRSIVLTSPILFAFPRSRTQLSPTTAPDPDSGLVIDIRSPESSSHGHGRNDDDEATPVREHTARLPPAHSYSRSEVLPRVVPMPTHTHADSADLASRPHTPFADYSRPHTPFDLARPTTPFADFTRPSTPFGELARPTTPFTDLDPVEYEAPASTTYLSPGISRKERGQGWSGEWNQRDMQDVIQKLRTLK